MAFVDELTIFAKAGDGGDGVVRWRREKFIARGGPAGGNGGVGADVYAEGVRDIGILSKYRHDTKFEAGNGENGGSRDMEGKNGKDLFIKIPVGSIVKNLTTEKEYQILKEGEKILLLKGGRGGYGNAHFKGPQNTTPQEWTPGKPGEKATFHIELKLIAHVGLVGLPNAGKSSLLNAVTAAEAKIANYPFTTLEPNLGVIPGGYIIADIPGLIEGASSGKGLGIKFLRHIQRTKILAHLISFENGDAMMDLYKQIRRELEEYDPELGERNEIIILSKTDITSEDIVKEKKEEFEKLGKQVFAISVFDDKSLKFLTDEIVKILRKYE